MPPSSSSRRICAVRRPRRHAALRLMPPPRQSFLRSRRRAALLASRHELSPEVEAFSATPSHACRQPEEEMSPPRRRRVSRHARRPSAGKTPPFFKVWICTFRLSCLLPNAADAAPADRPRLREVLTRRAQDSRKQRDAAASRRRRRASLFAPMVLPPARSAKPRGRQQPQMSPGRAFTAR